MEDAVDLAEARSTKRATDCYDEMWKLYEKHGEKDPIAFLQAIVNIVPVAIHGMSLDRDCCLGSAFGDFILNASSAFERFATAAALADAEAGNEHRH